MTYDCHYCNRKFIVTDDNDTYVKVLWHLEEHLRLVKKINNKLLDTIKIISEYDENE